MSDHGIRFLQASDIPSAMRLAEAAGWNQTAGDWARLLEVQPDGCFALEQDGVIAATATAVIYGRDLGWVGMVLTLPPFRKRGFARLLMRGVMEFAAACGAARVGLDATEMGIALYREFGFEDQCPIERWERPPAVADAAELLDPWEFDAELDIAAFGCDRRAILEKLARAEAAAVPGLGYAMGRTGSKAAYLGPLVARSPETAERLLRWFVARHPGERLYWDLLPGNGEAATMAQAYGFRPVRRLTRMSTSAPAGGDPSKVFAIGGFEYG
jgi:GNAT superfamily N-acetyltransferase